MKKFLVLLLGALMVLGFATASFAIHDEAAQIEAGAAVAEPGTAFVLGGDARVRGYMNKDFDYNSDSDAGEVQRYDSRARFTIDAKTAGGIELRTRMTLGNDGGNYTWGETNGKAVYWDWAYIHAPLGFVPITVDAGNQRANWAYKFFVWDSPADRLKFSGSFNNVKISVGTDKVSEATGDNVDADGDAVGGDYDKYFATVGTNFGDWGVNLLYINYQDGRPLASDSDCLSGVCNNDGADADGNTWDLWVTGKIGPVGAHLEYVTRNGDLFEDPNDGENPNGAYLAVDFATGPFVVFGAYAYTRNGYLADNDFAPTLLYGDVQATAAISHFGEIEAGGVSIGTADTDAVVIGGVFNFNEAMSFSARYANAKLDPFKFDETKFGPPPGTDLDGDGVIGTAFCDGDCDEGTIQEFDIQADYKISKNLTYTIAYGQASLSGDLFDDFDDPSTLINMLNYKF